MLVSDLPHVALEIQNELFIDLMKRYIITGEANKLVAQRLELLGAAELVFVQVHASLLVDERYQCLFLKALGCGIFEELVFLLGGSKKIVEILIEPDVVGVGFSDL